MRYFIKIQYDGSEFFGFQRQKSKKTVQGELERALSIINKSNVLVKGAGRTDVGVHALGQGVHFDLEQELPTDRLKRAINSIVYPFIHVVLCKKASIDFHARFSVVKKSYIYKIWKGDFSPFKENYYLQYDYPIDIEKLNACARLFIGQYDFHNFVSGERDNYDGTIYDVSIFESENEIIIRFIGKSFYRYMVRNLVGAMLDVNEGKCELLLLEQMLKDKDFDYQLRTAKPQGLYLEDVIYDE